MEKIGKTKLTMNKDMKVVVYSDVYMKDENDADDLYFVMFNILADPLRLSLCVVSEFFDYLVNHTDINEAELNKMLKTDPEAYLGLVQNNYAGMVESSATEKVKIKLDNKVSADQARAIVTSLLAKGEFKQVTTYKIPGKDPFVREQIVDTTPLQGELTIMLDIIKKWHGFDLETYMKSMGQ
jgi:hypothetical protein